MDPDRFRIRQQEDYPTNTTKQNPLAELKPATPPTYGGRVNKSKRSKSWVWLAAAVVIVILGLGSWLVLSSKSKTTKPVVAVKKTVQAKPSAVSSKPTTNTLTYNGPTTSYAAAAFGATFSYPTNWTVVNNGSAPLTLTSPVMSLLSANNQTVNGQIVMSMGAQGSVPPAVTANSSVAVLTSQKLSYNQPTPDQAASTYVSFVQYPTTTTRGGLNAIFVSGNYGYQKYQIVPSSNLAQVDPLIYFSFYSCASSTCPISTRVPLTIAASDWDNSSLAGPISYIIKSFAFS